MLTLVVTRRDRGVIRVEMLIKLLLQGASLFLYAVSD